MDSIGYYNGQFGPPEEMKIPMLDRAVFFGDGCYEAAFVLGGAVLDLDDHIARLRSSLRGMRIERILRRSAEKGRQSRRRQLRRAVRRSTGSLPGYRAPQPCFPPAGRSLPFVTPQSESRTCSHPTRFCEDTSIPRRHQTLTCSPT